MTLTDLEKMRDIITLFQRSGSNKCVFDIGGVTFIDSSALGMLLLAREAALAQGIDISIRHMRNQVKRIMEVVRFDRLFVIED
jgi:stage II sporulation protein AA (anti-sigma F factor antagonist)